MSSHVLWSRVHTQFMQLLVSPSADILRTLGTRGWRPATTVHQTLEHPTDEVDMEFSTDVGNSYIEVTSRVVILR